MEIVSKITPDKAGRITTKACNVSWTYRGKTKAVTIPKGTRYRPGLSIRVGFLGLLDLFAPTYCLEDASAPHDWLYRNRHKHSHSRAEADAVILADENDPKWIRYIAWGLIRTFGWAVW